MRLLAVVSKLTGVSTTVESSAVTLNAPSIVKLSVAREEISQLTRINQDLVVRLHSGETITIKNFYVTNDLGASQLVLAENDGTLWWVENPQAGLHFEQIADINELLVTSGASHEAGGAVWPWVLAGAVAAGGIAAIASSGGGDSHHHSDGDNPPPDNTNPDGNPPDNSNPGGSTPNGNTPGSSNPVDTTPPLAPGELLISADGKTVSGQAEAGSTITIKDPSGNVVGEGKADSDGKFSIDLTAPQISGEQLTVTATDDAGNTGPSATIDAPNIPLPDTPVITAAIDDAAPLTGTLSNNQFTNDSTPTLEGTGSAGTVIHIYANGQEIGSTTVDTSGNWRFAITSALADGENHFTAIATNVKGESSESARFTLTIDTLSPDAPRVELIADNTGLLTGPLQNNDRTDEAKPLFSGQGEAGNTITIKEGSTVIGSATVDENGRWTFTPTTPLSDGEHTFTVEQSDKAGNTSRVTTTPTIIVDTTPPDAAIIDNVAKDGTTVSGTAEAGCTVSIYDPAGNYLGSTITGENNHFSITLNPAQTHGERLEARIQDAVGNIGPATEFTASDSQYPAQPTILTVTDDAGAVTGLLKNGDATDDNRPTLSGTAEPGSTISINDNGFPVATFPPIVADADGKWSFTPSLALADGDHVFTATATNDRGTSGQSVSFTIDIDTQPPVLEGLAVSDVGDKLTGTTEAGSTVVIKDSLGNTLGSGTAGDDGTFSIGISPAKINGETLSISVTDKAANSGPVETLNAPDKTAPAAPDGLTVATDGLSVSGQAEAGATVTIRDSSNTVLGSAVANGNGQFIVPLNTAQTNGQALIATATDVAKNESAAATVIAPDSTAPEMPKNVVISEDGTSISGTAEPGSAITIATPDGKPLGSGKADGEGHFTLPLVPAQTNGEQVTVTATDSANNVSPPTTAQAPDITAPDKPIITQVLDDVESFTGPLVNGQTTNDNRPTLSGTAEAGARVEIFDNGVSLGLATLQPNGTWTFTPSQNLGEGAHRLTVIATDAKGNASPAASFDLVVDTQSPQQPVITFITDDAPGILGSVAHLGLTNDSTPTINGTGEPGSTVHLYQNGARIADIIVGNSGVWSYAYTTASPLADDTYTFTVTASDSNGNTTPFSTDFTITIDTQAPAAPGVIGVADGDGNTIDTNQITQESQPRLSGSGTAGDTIILYDNGNAIGQALVGTDGRWQFTPPAALGDGDHLLTARANDPAGNESPESISFTLRIDTQAPDAPQIVSAAITSGEGEVLLANGSITNQRMPTLSGTGEPGAIITLYNNGVELATVQVNPQGSWTYPLTRNLSEGLNILTATATDAAGNSSPTSGVFSVTLDTQPPAQPDAPLISDNVAPVIGNIGNNGATNDTTPTFSGTGEIGSTIILYNNDSEIGRTTVGDNGSWNFTPAALTPETYTITVTETDIAGNISPPSASVTFTLDTTAPANPVITFAEDNVGEVQDTIVSGATTDDNTPVIHGTGDIGSIITLYNGSSVLGVVTVDETGTWTLPVTSALPDGVYTLTAIAADAAGNSSGVSNSFTFTVDTVPLQPPVVNEILDDVAPVTGPLTDGAFTNDRTLTINGSGENGSTVTIYDNGVAIGTALVTDGVWTFNTPELSEVSHALTFSATDDAGNTTAQTQPITITVDITAPPAPTVQTVDDDGTRVAGLADPYATVEIHHADGTLVGSAVANGTGEFVVTLSPAQTDGGTLTAIAIDRAGNNGPATNFPASDSGLPAVPAITAIEDDVGSVQGNIAAGGATDDTTPTLRGTTDIGSTVEVFIDGDSAGFATVDASGNWIFEIATPLSESTHYFTVQATNANGPGGLSAPVGITVDLSAPAQPVITSATDDVPGMTGTLDNGALTNDSRPTLNGTGEAGATITLYENGTVIGTTTAQPDGAWSVATSTLASGTHVITAVATDAAGNSSPNSTAFTLTVDTTAPQTPILTSVVDDVAGGVTGNLANGQITNDNRPTLNGTAEAGSVVSIYDGNTLLGVTSANAGGTWSFTPTTGLNDGTRILTVTATDPAGNVSPATSGFTIVVDTLAPTVPLITSIVDDVPNNTGAIGNGQSTNDTQPTLNGTAEANSAVSIFDNGALVATVNANASGNWSWTPTAALGQGSHAYSVSAADAAGNVSAASPSITIIVDTIAPGAPGNLVINATGNRVTGTAEAGSTVTITSDTGVVLGTATADGTGSFTATLTPAQTNGQPLLAFAQDKAGNTGIAAGFTAPDTRVPEAPIITNVVDDVGIYTGAIANGQVTNDAQPTLNGTAQAGATVSIYNNGALLGTTTANASGNWSFTPTGNLTEGSHAFTATATNANGTGSVSTAATVIVDTLAPGTPSGTLSADGGSLSGQAEANSTVTVTLAGGVTLTTTAGSNGAWSLTLPTKQIEGQLINVTATDAAGNASGTLGITAPVLPLAARDNITSLDLTSTAVTSTQNYSDYGLLLVGALGDVASVLGNDTAQVEFTIAEGGTGDVTIDAAATGIVLSLLSTQEIVVQRYDTSLGAWTTIVNTAVGDFANLLTLTGSGVTLNLSGLGEGQYRVLTYNTSLLATGSYTSLDVDVHQTSAGIISGPTISTGNVMADDTAPTGTTVTAITNANGVSTPVGAGGVDIQGQYGTLHINQDGSYTYTLTKPTAGYGHKESFTYTITQNGVGSSAAQLVINLGPAPVPGSVIATDNNASLVFDTHVSYVNNGPSTQSGVTVLSVGLGNVLNANLLDDMTNPIIFNVEEGATRTMTLQGTVGGVSLVSTFDLYVYRFNDAIQQYEQFRVEKSWINTLLLAGQSQPLTLTLPGGEYLFVLNTASGISVLTGYTLAISQDHTYAVDSITANTTGNVLTNDVAPTGALLTEVNGVAIAATGTTEVNGLYGSLIIDARGNYTYTLKNGVGADSIKTPDSFIYTVKAPNGDTDTASLNITPTARALDAINDVSDTLSVATLQDTAAWLDSSVGSASWGLLGKSGSGSGTFDVATGTVLKGASLVFDVSTLITLGNLNISWAIQENGTVIRNGTVPVANITLGSATVTVNLSGLELDAGTYTLNFTGTNTLAGAATITPRVIGTTVDLDNFETSGTHTVPGNIFDGSDAAGAMDQLNTVNTRLSISGYNGSAATLDAAANTTSATIQGHYGTLQINLDGAYTYTLNNGVAMSSITSKEVFTYQLDDKMGHTDSATLTIDMAPQIVSTNQNDVLIGSAYGDTLIYHLLNGADATGGNGVDRWQNFSTAQGDKIDIHELLTGWDHQAATLGNFVQVHTSGANTVISVDRDGAGSAFKSTDLVTLENVQLTLNDLLQNNHLITGG
ncbi:BapA prefix-like domain-containing protein [Salmonella enterica]|nr:BapA prefix-like domain-containing protein [Salmonella enterica]